jgi:hypothetical protein
MNRSMPGARTVTFLPSNFKERKRRNLLSVRRKWGWVRTPGRRAAYGTGGARG